MIAALLKAWLLLGFAGSVGPPDTRALIEQALDEPANITLENIKLAEAIRLVSQQTGVRIVMTPEVMNFVPHGGGTLVQRVQIAKLPLRQGLAELFSPLGMTWVVRDDGLEIVPKEALLCLGRPATWEELDTLAQIAAIQPGLSETALGQLQNRVQMQVAIPDAWPRLAEAIRAVGAGGGDQVLSVACNNLGWAWCLSGTRIVVGGREHQLRRQLLQPVSMRMNNKPLVDVLNALARNVNVAIRTEPGALASLSLGMQRNFSLNAQNEPAEQVLEKIAAYTGLGYLVDPDGVMYFRPGINSSAAISTPPGEGPSGDEGAGPSTAQPGAGQPSGSSDPYVAKLIVPLEEGKTMEWLIRRSELPSDLRERRDQDLKEAFDSIRRQSSPRAPSAAKP